MGGKKNLKMAKKGGRGFAFVTNHHRRSMCVVENSIVVHHHLSSSAPNQYACGKIHSGVVLPQTRTTCIIIPIRIIRIQIREEHAAMISCASAECSVAAQARRPLAARRHSPAAASSCPPRSHLRRPAVVPRPPPPPPPPPPRVLRTLRGAPRANRLLTSNPTARWVCLALAREWPALT